MNPESLALYQSAISAVIALLVVGTIYTLIQPLLGGDKLKKRMASVADTRESLRKAHMACLQDPQKGLRPETRGFVRQLVDQLSLEKLLAATDLKDKLAQAGLRGERPVYIFYFARLFLPIALGIFGIVFFVIMNVKDWQLMQRVAATMGMVTFGYYLPAIWVKNMATKRAAAILPVFPDALDLLLICVESGMSIELAFNKVAEEMAENSVELAEEMSLTTAELSFMQNRRQAYENLARRNNHPGIRGVATALVQSERYGTPLGSTLRTMANENRQMRVLAAEKKAAALPAKLTVPMILFFLPVLFIVILTPAGMRLGSALT
jgi:tight adherence protein C